MTMKSVESKYMKNIYCCDICGFEQETSMSNCEICGRDVCYKHVKWNLNKRHFRLCCECHDLGEEIFMAENMADDYIKETDERFDKLWENVKNSVLDLKE